VYVQRVIAGLSGSAGSLQALRYAAEMARCHDAALVPVLAWQPPGGQLADRRYPCAELRSAWKQAAWDRLWRAIDLAIGGPPDDLRFNPQIVQGEAGAALTLLAREAGDVLVVGAGRRGALRRVASGRVARYCIGRGASPVIAVPPGQLAAQARGLRSWMHRHRLQPEDARLHAADA
jgi:nucleotide-binding universal stress UspA family protein